MKKSEIYYVAQLAVLEYTKMTPGEKLEVLALFSGEEKFQKAIEDQKEREAQKEAELNG